MLHYRVYSHEQNWIGDEMTERLQREICVMSIFHVVIQDFHTHSAGLHNRSGANQWKIASSGPLSEIFHAAPTCIVSTALKDTRSLPWFNQ